MTVTFSTPSRTSTSASSSTAVSIRSIRSMRRIRFRHGRLGQQRHRHDDRPGELIFGAGMTVNSFSAAGSGFTNRIITTPDADIAEDRNVTRTGSYSATAPLRWLEPGSCR